MNSMAKLISCGALALQMLIPHSSDAKSNLAQGEVLYPNNFLESPNGQYRLWMQSDGNLVLYNSNGSAEWASDTYGYGLRAVMQADGNLVVYDDNWYPHWASDSAPTVGAELNIQDDGNLVIYGLAPVWETSTVWGECGLNEGRPATGAILNVDTGPFGIFYTSPQMLSNRTGRDRLTSTNGCYSLILQADNNLVLYRMTDYAVLWSTDTWRANSPNGSRAVVQGDGNFVLYSGGYYSSGYGALWDSYDPGQDLLPGEGRTLIMQNDGNLVLYTNRVAVWAKGQKISHTHRYQLSTWQKIFGVDGCVSIGYDSTKNDPYTGPWKAGLSCN